MDRWIIYLQERFPLPTFAVLAAGISLSGIFLAGGPFGLFSFFLSFIGVLLCFAFLRLMEDVKNVEKDRIGNRDRPLARGVISKVEAQQVLDILQIFLFAYSMVIWVALGEIAALGYACTAITFWLLYRNFYMDGWLGRHTIIQGVLKVLFVFPLAFFALSAGKPSAAMVQTAWSFGLMLSGAFFCYDICRNLNPHAHPILGTYVHFFGFRRAFELAAIALAVSAIGAIALDLWPILLPCQCIVLISLVLPFFHQDWYYFPDIAAGLSLMLHAWAGVLLYYVS